MLHSGAPRRVPRVPVLGPGSRGRLGLPFFVDFQPLTLDFQLLIPDRYSFNAKSSQYYKILLYDYY
jgi:hypothetical protein